MAEAARYNYIYKMKKLGVNAPARVLCRTKRQFLQGPPWQILALAVEDLINSKLNNKRKLARLQGVDTLKKEGRTFRNIRKNISLYCVISLVNFRVELTWETKYSKIFVISECYVRSVVQLCFFYIKYKLQLTLTAYGSHLKG